MSESSNNYIDNKNQFLCEMVKKYINARMTSSIIFGRHHNATLLWNWSPISEKVSTYFFIIIILFF